MKKILILLLTVIPFFALAQFDGQGTFHANNMLINGNARTPARYVSTSQTLLKTDVVVLASGDITVQAPAITAADSGLTITVKNVGLHTDLVTFHIDGTVADSITDARLVRWCTRTIIAGNDGKWYTKERLSSRIDYIYDVAENGSFKSLHEIFEFLHEHMAGPSVIRLGGGIYPINQTEIINLPYPLDIRGFSYITSRIVAGTGLLNKPMFRTFSDISFENIQIDGSTLATYGQNAGEDFCRLVGSGTYNEFRNFSLTSFNIGILDSSDNEIWMTEGDIVTMYEAAIKFTGANDSVRFRVVSTDFIGCDKGVWLFKGDKSYIDIDGGCTFRNLTTNDTAIVYVPATFTNSLPSYIHSTAWNGVGYFIKGFDFSRLDARDVNWFVQNNAGLEDKSPHAKINVKDNTVTTTITAINTFYTPTLATHVVTVLFNVAATSGTFTITYGDQTTAAINWDASDATIKAALEALTNITTVTVTTVTAQTSWTVRFDTANEGWQKVNANIGSLGTTTAAYYYGNNYSCKWKIEDNKVTYLPVNMRDVWMDISTNWLCDRNSVRYDVSVARYNSSNVLQGYFSPVTGTMTLSATASPSTAPTMHAYFEDVTAGDYFRIVIQKPTNAGDIVTLSDINVKIITQ